MKSVSRFVSYADLEYHRHLKYFIRLVVNDLRISLMREGVHPSNILTSIHPQGMGLMFEVYGEVGGLPPVEDTYE